MQFSGAYLAQRFLYRILDFFHHWYIDGSRAFGRRFMAMIASADRSIALRVTVRHFFEPLYKDYSFVGRILGVIFRTFRIAIGLVVYCFFAVIFLIAYAIWLIIPLLTLYYAATTF